MVSFQKSVADNGPYLKSFEETYKTAYSHGLEAIYALENVDVKSIRTINIFDESPTETFLKPFTPPKSTPQYDFNFGYPFFCQIPPFFLDEPIQSLELSRLAEKALLTHQKLKIRDLINDDLNHYAFLRGFGQGHIDEVRTKLSAFIAGRDPLHAETIDFASWLRVLTAEGDRKKWYFLLERYGLADLLPMTSSELIDLKKVTPSQRAEWERQAIQMADKGRLNDTWKQLSARFVIPWIRARYEIASHKEINERLVKMSDQAEKAKQILHFMESAFYGDQSALAEQLISLNEAYFTLSLATQSDYLAIRDQALTYFYHSNAKFTLSQLMRWIERDFACKWIGFPTGFIEKVLRIAPEFLVRKDEKGQIIVMIS